jgi:FkbM family methyltransferase
MMTEMTDVIDRVTSTSAGAAIFKAVRPVVHFMRRVTNPGIPTDLMVSKAAYRGRKFSFLHRRWSTTDLLAIDQCFKQLQYDMPSGPHGALIDSFYQEILSAGRQPLIIDCGANIGASVTWFSARYPEAHIVAIEPAPDNFSLLRSNCAGLDVDLREAGISDHDGSANLRWIGSTMGYRTNADNVGIEIEMLSVSTLLAAKPESRYVPFLLKIDIEGAEKTLFKGDAAALNRFPLIVLELHDWLMPGQLTSQEFFRFHAASGREFCMNNENVASVATQSSLQEMTHHLKN